MIFTRRFGALRARPTFRGTAPVIDVEEFDVMRRVEYEAERAARAARKGHHRDHEDHEDHDGREGRPYAGAR